MAIANDQLAPIEAALGQKLLRIADQSARLAPTVEIVFLTNILAAEMSDLGPDGVLNYAQYYSREQADNIIHTLQTNDYSVLSHFDEASFFQWALNRPVSDRTTIVFNTAEGGSGQGRRALIPAFCNLVGLPILNSGAHANTLCRHKFHANLVLAQAGLRVPNTWMFDKEWVGASQPACGARVILKPAYESMSIGIANDSIVTVDDHFDEVVLERRTLFGQALVAQEFITGDEIGIPVLHADRTHALPIVSFQRSDGTQFASRPKTFEDESIDHNVAQVFYECHPQQYLALQASAVKAFDVLGMSGVGRMDLRVDADGRGWIFDTSESPPPLFPTAYSRALGRLGVGQERMLVLWIGLKLLELGLISGV